MGIGGIFSSLSLWIKTAIDSISTPPDITQIELGSSSKMIDFSGNDIRIGNSIVGGKLIIDAEILEFHRGGLPFMKSYASGLQMQSDKRIRWGNLDNYLRYTGNDLEMHNGVGNLLLDGNAIVKHKIGGVEIININVNGLTPAVDNLLEIGDTTHWFKKVRDNISYKPYDLAVDCDRTATYRRYIIQMLNLTADRQVTVSIAMCDLNGFRFRVKVRNCGGHNVIVQPAGGRTIDGAANYSFGNADGIHEFISDGTNLVVIL